MKKSVFLIIQLLKAPHNFMVLKKVIDRIKGNCYDLKFGSKIGSNSVIARV